MLGDKLVKEFLFESDFTEDPVLPSPNQLKYKILIKNKKIHHNSTPQLLKHKVYAILFKREHLCISIVDKGKCRLYPSQLNAAASQTQGTHRVI